MKSLTHILDPMMIGNYLTHSLKTLTENCVFIWQYLDFNRFKKRMSIQKALQAFELEVLLISLVPTQ